MRHLPKLLSDINQDITQGAPLLSRSGKQTSETPKTLGRLRKKWVLIVCVWDLTRRERAYLMPSSEVTHLRPEDGVRKSTGLSSVATACRGGLAASLTILLLTTRAWERGGGSKDDIPPVH